MNLLREFLTLAITRDGATVSAYRRPLGYQQLSITAAATPLTIPSAPLASSLQVGYAVIQCAGSAATDFVTWRDDGTNPDATHGMKLFSGQELDYSGDVYKIVFFLGAGTCTLNISYYA